MASNAAGVKFTLIPQVSLSGLKGIFLAEDRKENNMKTWACYGIVTGSKYLGTVEAETKEEAEEKALELESTYIDLCHQCASECEDAEVHDIQVEEESK
jgi:hypothetical protein